MRLTLVAVLIQIALLNFNVRVENAFRDAGLMVVAILILIAQPIFNVLTVHVSLVAGLTVDVPLILIVLTNFNAPLVNAYPVDRQAEVALLIPTVQQITPAGLAHARREIVSKN